MARSDARRMSWTRLLLGFMLLDAVSALNSTSISSKGCKLIVPRAVQEHVEPEPKTDPLLIHVYMWIFRIRDVPDSGGSFSADLMQVNC